MTIIAYGKPVAEKIRNEIKKEIEENNYSPNLAIILTGNNESGKIYVRNKQKNAEKLGMQTVLFEFPSDVTEEALISTIDKLNEDESVDAILVQLPLPEHINKYSVLDKISPDKDVDGFHFVNSGKLFQNRETFTYPCTPTGILRLLREHNVKLEGKNAVVIGRSEIVGKPLALMLMHENATVTVLHSKSQNKDFYLRNADIIVCAAGKPGLLKGSSVKEGAIVIDVGINRVDGKIVGDVDFDSVYPKASLITPVPGGVGPLTIIHLAVNTLKLHKLRLSVTKNI